MRPVRLTYKLAAAVVGAIAASQTTAGAGNLLINGSLASGGVATMLAQQYVGLTSTANYSAVTFVVTGTNENDHIISESLAGPNNGTVNTVNSYLTITSIHASGALATAITVDTVGAGRSKPIPLDIYTIGFQTSCSAVVSGTVNYQIDATVQPIYDLADHPEQVLWDVPVLAAGAISAVGNLSTPGTAISIQINSGTGAVNITLIQQGLI